MTDGIIQEVFDKHLSDKKIHLGDYLMCKRIQQELIEKISLDLNYIFDSESCNDAHFNHGFNLYEVGKNVRKALIGDTT